MRAEVAGITQKGRTMVEEPISSERFAVLVEQAGLMLTPEQFDELREGYQKKEYRNPENYKALFRDFNEIFEGVQKQRPRTNPESLKA